MKIAKPADIPQTDALRSAQAGAIRPAGNSGGGPIEQVGAAASVQLSETSRKLVSGTASGDAPIRAEKVEEVRRAIQEGQFHVNAAVVADKMISEAAQLLETLSQPR